LSYLVLSTIGKFEDEKIKQLIEMYQDDLNCSKLTTLEEIKTWLQQFLKTSFFKKCPWHSSRI